MSDAVLPLPGDWGFGRVERLMIFGRLKTKLGF